MRIASRAPTLCLPQCMSRAPFKTDCATCAPSVRYCGSSVKLMPLSAASPGRSRNTTTAWAREPKELTCRQPQPCLSPHPLNTLPAGASLLHFLSSYVHAQQSERGNENLQTKCRRLPELPYLSSTAIKGTRYRAGGEPSPQKCPAACL